MFYTDPAFAGGAIAAVGLLYMYIQYRRALTAQTRPKLKRPAGWGGWSGGPELHSHATVDHAPSYIILLLLYYPTVILYRRVENQWGDGMRGLRYQRARTSLEELEKLKDGPHIKNWRPQALIVSSLFSSSPSS